MFEKVKRVLWRRSPHRPITWTPKGKARGTVLFSYITESLRSRHDDKLFGHSNQWESREIARILVEIGFIVEAIDWHNMSFMPEKKYDVIFDIYKNLQRLAPFVGPDTKKLLHLTGSYGPFQNAAELLRVKEFENRTGCLYSPKRLVENLELLERSLRISDSCSLIGNPATLETYPDAYSCKTTLIPVSGSYLPSQSIVADNFPRGREFLWFFGSGAVHKGLDLVLEVFRSRPDLTLHVVGDLAGEPDFLAAAAPLLRMPNIHYHGRLDPRSIEFAHRLRNVFCFIAPSCSEGTSPAAITCLQVGLYPIISRESGVSLPDGCGTMLEELSIDAIERAVVNVGKMSANEIRQQTLRCQALALEKHSREAFSREMKKYLLGALE